MREENKGEIRGKSKREKKRKKTREEKKKKDVGTIIRIHIKERLWDALLPE